MPEERSERATAARLRETALSRWDNEGGYDLGDRHHGGTIALESNDIPELTNAELVQMRIRVIALENLVISLLAEASDVQRGIAREMAGFIAPRPGAVHHPLTTQAAVHMLDLIDRADRFRP